MSPCLATVTHNPLHCSQLLLRASESDKKKFIDQFDLVSLLNRKMWKLCLVLYHQTINKANCCNLSSSLSHLFASITVHCYIVLNLEQPDLISNGYLYFTDLKCLKHPLHSSVKRTDGIMGPVGLRNAVV